MSVKPTVHEVYRKAAARLSSKERRVTIAELVEFLGKYLPDIKLEDVGQKS